MKTKKEFYGIMTAHSADIYHGALKMDLVLGDGEVVQVWRDGELWWEKKEKEPTAAATA